jgi:hypothetical protein
VEEDGPLPPQQPVELRESAQVSPRTDRPTELLEMDELDARLLRRFAYKSPAVRTDGDLVLARECGQKRGDVPLSAPDLAERHEYEDVRAAVAIGAPSRRGRRRAF